VEKAIEVIENFSQLVKNLKIIGESILQVGIFLLHDNFFELASTYNKI
jgi:hypothetical protein